MSSHEDDDDWSTQDPSADHWRPRSTAICNAATRTALCWSVRSNAAPVTASSSNRPTPRRWHRPTGRLTVRWVTASGFWDATVWPKCDWNANPIHPRRVSKPSCTLSCGCCRPAPNAPTGRASTASPKLSSRFWSSATARSAATPIVLACSLFAIPTTSESKWPQCKFVDGEWFNFHGKKSVPFYVAVMQTYLYAEHDLDRVCSIFSHRRLLLRRNRRTWGRVSHREIAGAWVRI